MSFSFGNFVVTMFLPATGHLNAREALLLPKNGDYSRRAASRPGQCHFSGQKVSRAARVAPAIAANASQVNAAESLPLTCLPMID